MRHHVNKLSILIVALLIAALGMILAVSVKPESAKSLQHSILGKHPALQPGTAPLQSSVSPDTVWETATPREAGMDPVKFAKAMDTLPSPAVIIRNGKMVGSKGDISRAGYIWSASKSLTALIAGRLIQQGVITYDTLVPGSDVPTGPLASYRHFMSMTSDFNLSPHSPGGHYAYNNGAVTHYGDYMKNTYFHGHDPVQMLRGAYLDTIGFQDPIGFNGYVSGWHGGWSMSTRDLARVGYLVLRGGNWNGVQVLPASFVNDLYNNQVPVTTTESTDRKGRLYKRILRKLRAYSQATEPADRIHAFYNEYPVGTPDLPGAYSFGFWLPQNTPRFGGTPSRTPAVSMSGAFGTTVHISRAADLVIVAVNTSQDHRKGKISAATLDLFANAIITPPLPRP